MDDKRRLMEEKAALLNEASKAYYQDDREIMSNQEYDRIYDELEALEKETGIVLASSPTAKVGYAAVDTLPKERHPQPMLSLDKTKDTQALKEWLGDKQGLLSWKLDGLTIVLTYSSGKLEKAVTRGDGTVGEVITNNAKVFDNIPLVIPEKGEVVIRGEAVISYKDFEDINRTIGDADAKYKNPRNLCSGTVRQLNNEITAKRHVKFYGFHLAGGGSFTTRREQMEFMKSQGFETVEYVLTDAGKIEEDVARFEKNIENLPVPSDGLVLIYDDIAYGESLGSTAKFPRDSIAFKWKDEMKTTRLREILWNVSRTGLINPIAIFEPVQLEGTTVSRASVHNLSIVRELKLGIGDEIKVYKANMIIPQIAENLTESGPAEPPRNCPVCGSKTYIEKDNGVETLHCPNPDCPAKKIKAFSHFVSRNAMNIEGLSEATLEKFIDEAMIKSFADVFRLSRYKDRIIAMEGFGEKSYERLANAVKKASKTTPARLLLALGIPNIGAANARMISEFCENKWDRISNLNTDELLSVDGIGEIMAEEYTAFFSDDKNKQEIDELLKEITLDESYLSKSGGRLEGLGFVVTGTLKHFENREKLKELIAEEGGKVSSAVSKKTDYLINNDADSSSSKNKKAAELGIPVISEDEFLRLLDKN
ncbi:MAG: NAD-dependent DNA ligase LigA [Anaerovoracaceae bacterium]